MKAERKTTAPPRKPLHPAERYIADAAAGRVVVSKWVRLACQRHERDLRHGPSRGLRFDRTAAQRVLNFFSFLRHSKGEWAQSTFELQPWQQALLWILFGWMGSDGTRRFRVAYTEIARKNGKSTLAAGVGLYLFFADREPGAEVYTAATKRDQARIVHGEAVRMTRSSPELRKRIRVFKDNLSVEATNSKFEPLGADDDSMDGLNVSGVVIDELHAHKTRGVYDILDTATGARRQPLLFCITTAGSNRQSVCWEQHEYSTKLLEEVLEDDTHFAWLCAIDPDDDWQDETCWPKANPNLHVSVKIEDLRRKVAKAKESPASANSIRRLHFNEWTQQDVRAIDMDVWRENGAGIPLKALRNRTCYAGLDLGSVSDLTAFALVFPPDEDDDQGLWFIKPFFWIPEDTIQLRVRRDRVRYDVWRGKKLLRITEGNATDYDVVRRDINQLAQLVAIKQIAVDRLFQGVQLCTQLMADGFDVISHGQGFMSMAAPTKTFEELLLGRKLAHGNHEVLTWMASNLSYETDAAGCQKPSKKKSGEKIDGIVAMFMGLGRATATAEHGSRYDNEGIDTL